MTRPILTRAARERCPHGRTVATLGRYEGRQWCEMCGAIFAGLHQEGIEDWPATDSADLEDMERHGQGRLPL